MRFHYTFKLLQRTELPTLIKILDGLGKGDTKGETRILGNKRVRKF